MADYDPMNEYQGKRIIDLLEKLLDATKSLEQDVTAMRRDVRETQRNTSQIAAKG